MIDPNCKRCWPNHCVHGEQSDSAEEVAFDSLKEKFKQALALLDEALEWMGRNPPTTGWGTLDRGEERDRVDLARRISALSSKGGA